MKHYDSVIIGHISQDRNIDHLGNAVDICGGAVLFSSAAAYALGHKVLAVTRIADKDRERLQSFTIPQEDVIAIPCASSTMIQNTYFTADKEKRACICRELGTPFAVEDVPADAEADIYHLAGLIYGDFPNELIPACAARGAVAVDVQTCLRHADMAGGGKMYFEDWKDKKELLPYVTFLKTDAAEAEIMTGTADRVAAAKQLHAWGAKEIMITHNTEVLIYDGKEIYTCPIRSRNLSGRTGRGDTTFASYINERLNADIPAALLTATALVSLKMETPGVFKGSRADVEAYIRDLYPEYAD